MQLAAWLVLSLVSTACAHHILCVFPVPTRSHNTLGKGIVDALLAAGHEVSWATPYPPKDPVKNLNIIDVSSTLAVFEGLDMTKVPSSIKDELSQAKLYAKNVSFTAVTTPALRDALVKNQYDAVVTEMFFSETDAGYAAVLKAPWILLSSTFLHPGLEALVDEVRSVPTIPILFMDFPVPMNLWQRFMTAFAYVSMRIGSWLESQQTSETYKAMFGPLAEARGTQLPAFEDALYNISILLVNSHPSFAHAHSLPPNVVEIGGYHIKDDIPPLPKDLQQLLDSSPQGVVYFSMGSVLRSSALAKETRQELLQVLGRLPFTVLWKFEETLENLPKNVHIRQWMPQASILDHPNVRLFITHGGMLSNLEALRYGVPLLAIPVFGDQPANAAKAVRAGYARSVKFSDKMAADIETEMKEMLSNDSYYKRAKELSRMFRKRPVAPSKLISHYIEVAIETKGAYHLRSKALLYAWHERWMLDVAAILFTILYIACIIIKKIFKFIFNIFASKKPQQNSTKSQKNGKKVKKH